MPVRNRSAVPCKRPSWWSVAVACADTVSDFYGRRFVILRHEGSGCPGIPRTKVRAFERTLDSGTDL